MAATNWFGRLHPTLQALIVIGAAFSFGGFADRVFFEFRGVPTVAMHNAELLDSLFVHERIVDRMHEVERSDMRQNVDMRQLRITIDSIVRVTCLTYAELRAKGWSDCIR